jgi:hypothetical protein
VVAIEEDLVLILERICVRYGPYLYLKCEVKMKILYLDLLM